MPPTPQNQYIPESTLARTARDDDPNYVTLLLLQGGMLGIDCLLNISKSLRIPVEPKSLQWFRVSLRNRSYNRLRKGPGSRVQDPRSALQNSFIHICKDQENLYYPTTNIQNISAKMFGRRRHCPLVGLCTDKEPIPLRTIKNRWENCQTFQQCITQDEQNSCYDTNSAPFTLMITTNNFTAFEAF